MQISHSESPELSTPSQLRRRRRREQRGKGRQEIVKNIACPTCREKGKDSTGNHLMVFKAGNGYCDRCSKRFSKEQVEEAQEAKTTKRASARRFGSGYNKNYKPDLTMDDMPYLGFHGDPRRGISKKSDEHFGIRTEISSTNGTPVARYYPAHTDGELFGYKKRILPKKWDKDVGTIKGTDLFGWHLCTGTRRTLVIVEGEEDCAAGWQLWKAMNARSTNSRVKRSPCHIISLSSGAKSVEKDLLHHFEDLVKYERIIWMGDNPKNDIEGQRALEKAVQILGVNKIYVPRWPEYKKDLCDILKLGVSEAVDVFADMYWQAEKYRPADVISGKDLKRSDVEREQISGVEIPFGCIQEKIDGIRLYEHTILFSGSGMGKSTVAKAIAHHLCTEEGWNVGNIFLEERDDKTQQSYIAYDNSISLKEYRKNFSLISDEDWDRSKERLLDNMLFLRHQGSIDPDVLMNKIQYMFAKGCRLIILDHISMVVTQSDDERKDIDSLMERIYTFCENNPVHVISIVHLNRNSKANFERGAEITSNSLRGSSGLLQMCWNALALEGDNQHGIYGDYRYPRLLKCRETGEVGLCDGALVYDKKTGRFSEDRDANKDDITDSGEYQKQTPSMGGGYDNKAS